MKVNLHNRSRRALVLNLPYDMCGEPSFCHRQMRGKVVQMSDGSKQVAPQKARLSTSLTILAGECKKGLPEAVLRAPEVQAAVKRGALRVESPKAEKPEAKSPEPPAPEHARASEPEPQPEPARKAPRRGGKS